MLILTKVHIFGVSLGLAAGISRPGNSREIAIFFPGISRNSSQFSRYFPGYVLTFDRLRHGFLQKSKIPTSIQVAVDWKASCGI